MKIEKSFEDLFSTFMLEIYSSINVCYDNNSMNAVLILLYSYIDQMAYLNMDEKNEFVDNNDYKHWIDNFMLSNKNCKLTCSSSDLYSARCAIIHTRTSFSKEIKRGKATRIYYCFKGAKKEVLDYCRKYSNVNYIVIVMEELRDAVADGIMGFYKYFETNPEKKKIAYERLKKMLFTTTKEETAIISTLLNNQ